MTLGHIGMSCGVQWRASALCNCAFPKDRDGGGSTGNAASAKRPLPRRRGGQREQRRQNAKSFWEEERARQANELEMKQKEERRRLRTAQRGSASRQRNAKAASAPPGQRSTGGHMTRHGCSRSGAGGGRARAMRAGIEDDDHRSRRKLLGGKQLACVRTIVGRLQMGALGWGEGQHTGLRAGWQQRQSDCGGCASSCSCAWHARF